MLQSVDVFKDDISLHVRLSELTRINFIVGENKSGKSRVLSKIHTLFARACMLDEEQKRLLFDYEQSPHFFEVYPDLQEAMICVNEPETHLHPSLQKQIPFLLEALVEGYPKCQFFLATHSPFIISSAGSITDIQRSTLSSPIGFIPTQKVYYLVNSSIANKRGEIGIDDNGKQYGEYGYWGTKANFIAGRMLGSGLTDFIQRQQASYSHDSPILILCEGEGKDEDARIYNKIFQNYKPSVLFVSARGTTQLNKSFELIREIQKGLSANFQLRMLRDRDHEFISENDIMWYQDQFPGRRVLRKRAIECYLFTSETASLLLKSRGLKLSHKFRRSINSLQRVIQFEAESGVLGNSYKRRLKELFKQILADSGYWVFPTEAKKTTEMPNMDGHLETKSITKTMNKKKHSHYNQEKNITSLVSDLIKPGTKSYRNLKKDIFG